MVQKVQRELFVARRIEVDVKENDRVDIRCGGPQYLGFDFYVDADEKPDAIRKFVQDCLKKEGINDYLHLFVDSTTSEVPHIWTRDQIIECIRKEAPNLR